MAMKRRTIMNIMVSLAMVIVLSASLVPPASSTFASREPQISVIVQGESVDQSAQAVANYGGAVTSRLDVIDGVGALVPAQTLDRLKAEPGIKVTLNIGVNETGDNKPDDQKKDDQKNQDGASSEYLGPAPATDYPEVVGADLAWQKGVTGKNITVAVVDTGMAMLPGILFDSSGRKPRIIGWKDFVDNSPLPIDPNGHGTHITGVIANSQKGPDDHWDGMAPDVNLVGVRVLDEKGTGSYEKVIQGIDWVLKNKNKLNIRVMNLSLQALVQSPYWSDPLNQAVMNAWAEGITVIVAAGNGGPNPMSVGVPGNNPYVITTGAFTDNHTPTDWNDDYLAPFSAAGPTLDGFVKPDLIAPGAHMVSTMMPASYLAINKEATRITSTYYSMAGTSQAAAVVSGIVAMMLAKNPDLTPDQVKYRLMVTAIPWVAQDTQQAGYSMWQQGTGRVNAPDAIFGVAKGKANSGMDIKADLKGKAHYEGFSYFDTPTNQFRLKAPYDTWANGYGVWSGGYGVWSGGYGVWSGGYGVWSGGYGVWSGGYGVWSGGYGVWSGGYGVWSGGYGVWSGGYGVWSGSVPWANAAYADPVYITNYLAGKSPDANSSATSLQWVNEP
jgi:serine protease AprX